MQSFRNIRNAFLIPKLIIEMPYSTHQVICNVYNCNYINVYVHAYGIFSCTEECRQICKEVIKENLNCNCIQDYALKTTQHYSNSSSLQPIFSFNNKYIYLLDLATHVAECVAHFGQSTKLSSNTYSISTSLVYQSFGCIFYYNQFGIIIQKVLHVLQYV